MQSETPLNKLGGKGECPSWRMKVKVSKSIFKDHAFLNTRREETEMENKIVRTGGPELREGVAPFIERRGRGRVIEQAADPAISFGEVWRILRKRKWIIWTSAFVIFAAALGYTLAVTPRYRTTSIIEFNKSNTDSLDLDERSGMPGGANAMDYNVTQRTQVNALTSDTLALQVVHDLNLESRKEFSRSHSPVDYFRSVPDESKLPLEKAPHRLATVLKAYHKNLTVEPIPGTRMISIQFMDPDPDVSAKIVNNLVSDYTEQYFRIRYAATVQASDWLSQQLNDLKGQVESSQQKLADFQRQAGILGTDETHNIVMTRLQQIDGQLTTAQANRILAQAVWKLAETSNPELLPGLVNVSLIYIGLQHRAGFAGPGPKSPVATKPAQDAVCGGCFQVWIRISQADRIAKQARRNQCQHTNRSQQPC